MEKFAIDTPASNTLVQLTHEKFKEFYDPQLPNDALSKYAVACVAKGMDRKKLLFSLNTVVNNEDACRMIVDWLIPYVKNHMKELKAPKPPAQPAASTSTSKPKKTTPGGNSANAGPPAPAAAPVQQPAQAAPEGTAQPAEADGEDDVAALLREDLPSDVTSDLEDDEEQPASPAQDHQAESAQPAQGQQPDQHGSDAGRPTRQDGQPQQAPAANGAATEEQPPRRSRVKSVIQWNRPSSEPGSAKKETPSAVDLEARRARFGDVRSSGGSDSRPAAESRSRPEPARERDLHRLGERRRSRSRSPVRAPIMRERDRHVADTRDDHRRRVDGDVPVARRVSHEGNGHAHEAARPRLRSVVSGGLDADTGAGAQEAEVASPTGRKQAPSQRPSVFSRLFKVALPTGDAPAGRQRAPRAMGSAVLRRIAPSNPPQEGEEDAVMGGGVEEGEHEETRPRSVLQRLEKPKGVQGRIAAGVKRQAPSADQEEPADEAPPQPVKAQRTGSAAFNGIVRAASKPGPGQAGAGRPATSTVDARQTLPPTVQAERAKVAAQVPLLAGVRSPLPPPKTTQAAAAAKPAGAKPATAKPGAAKPAVAVSKEALERAKLAQELKQKELEIQRMKAEIVIKEVMGPQAVGPAAGAAFPAHSDACTVMVQGLHPEVNQQLLAEHFRHCGIVRNVHIKYDPATSMACAAFVELDSPASQSLALQLDRSTVLGQVILVKPKVARPATTPQAPFPAAGPRPVMRLADAPPLPGKVSRTWVRPGAPQPTVM